VQAGSRLAAHCHYRASVAIFVITQILANTLEAGWLTVAVTDGACVLIQAIGLRKGWLPMPPGNRRFSGWQGASLVAITYVYFLIFAQFAFSSGCRISTRPEHISAS